MIIFGTRGVTYNNARGEFHCPSCNGRRNYAHKRVRRFFTLYFILVLPLDLLGEYVECNDCRDSYQLGVLDYDPMAASEAFEAEYARAVKRVMVLMMLADGDVDDEEIETIRGLYREIASGDLTETDVRAEVAAAQDDGAGAETFLADMAGTLNDHGKETVVRAAFMVAAADGEFAAEEMDLLDAIGASLQMTPAHLQGVLASVRATA